MAWPTTSNPRTEFVTLRLTKGEADDLDWLTAQLGTSGRSETLRIAQEEKVARERKRVAQRQSRKQSRRKGGA